MKDSNKTAMLFSYEWVPLLEAMKSETAVRIIFALITLDQTGEAPEIEFDSPLEAAVFNIMAETVIANNKAYAEKCEINRQNAKKGGAPKGNQNAAKQPKTTERLKKQPKQPDNDNDNDYEYESIKEKINKKEKTTASRFVRPSLEEVRDYCTERKNNVDPEQFIAFYESNGWKVGRNPMKDWKAAVRTWEKREREEHKHVETEHERTLRLLREATE